MNTDPGSLAAFGLAAVLSASLCHVLRPLLVQYALARPNARSSHVTPTPQGGGIAVLLGAFGAISLLGFAGHADASQIRVLGVVAAASTLLAIIGAWDDIRPLPALFRFAMQFAAVMTILFWAAPDLRLFPEAIPLAAERVLVVVAAVWFVNLTNFMDGLDWITVAAIVPAAVTLGLLAQIGSIDRSTGLLALALAGGLAGFAPFNRPVARLFLGDVGALPIGLLMAYLLYQLAGTGAFIAAILLPLYSVSDASVTLFRRVLRRERIWEAHRSHFYQRATDNGFSARSVSGHVFALNIVLAALAMLATLSTRLDLRLGALAIGIMLTGWLLRHFSAANPTVVRQDP